MPNSLLGACITADCNRLRISSTLGCSDTACKLILADIHLNLSADPEVLARHQPMVFGTDRIRSSYAAITALPEYAKPSFLLTFNEPNYAHLANDISSNIVDPATAASLWPQLLELFPPLGIQLVAPSPINCAGDVNCRNVGTAAGWLTAFQEVRLALTFKGPHLCVAVYITWMLLSLTRFQPRCLRTMNASGVLYAPVLTAEVFCLNQCACLL